MLGHRRTAVFVMAVIALVSGLVTGRDLWFTMAYLLGLLLIISFIWAWININWLHISRVTRTRRTQVGRPLEERFIVRNTSFIPKLWLEVRDFGSLPNHYTSRVINSLGPHGQYAWRITTICHQRGRYQLGPIRLYASDPFGFFPMSKDLDPTTNVVIYPMTFDIHRFALPVGILPGGEAVRRRTHYVTTNASGVRDYAPGDSFSRIHWRSTARRNRLIVKEFELDPLADIWVIPDMSVYGHVVPRSNPQPKATSIQEIFRFKKFELVQTTEEYTVTIAASLSQYFLRQDRAVGLMTSGQTHEVVQADRSERQLNRILETLAVIRAEGTVPVADLIRGEMNYFPRGTTIIVVTPDPREDWVTKSRMLMRRGLRVVTVLVNPASFGGARSAEGLMGLLQANNMVAYMVNAGDNLTAVLSSGQSQPGRFLM